MALRAFFNSVISGTAPFRTYVLVGFSVMALTAVMLFAMGREPICKCGEVWLWSGDIVSSNNSQHLLDPYSFTHVEHGFGFYVLLKFAAGGMPLPLRALFAVALESGWEVLENTDLVINKYREDTISLGYFGDSIVNSLSFQKSFQKELIHKLSHRGLLGVGDQVRFSHRYPKGVAPPRGCRVSPGWAPRPQRV